MLESLANINPVMLALLGGLFTWGMTLAGASLVFFFKEINQTLLNIMLGFAGGVMIAASFWSLLLPAKNMAEGFENPFFPSWLHIIGGLAVGAGFLMFTNRLLPFMNKALGMTQNLTKSWKRSILLVTAMTLHNIPEGLAYGVAFGLVATDPAALPGAVALAIGIGIQNFPEGAAVAIPLRQENMSRTRAFMYGQFSGIVEPIFAVIGAVFAMTVTTFLPFALSFAAGAMILVVVKDLIPESQAYEHESRFTTQGIILGFIVMTFLDITLG